MDVGGHSYTLLIAFIIVAMLYLISVEMSFFPFLIIRGKDRIFGFIFFLSFSIRRLIGHLSDKIESVLQASR